MNVIYQENQIISNGKIIHSFNLPVKKIVAFSEIIVVCLKVEPKSIFNENVFGLNFLGEIVWQIETVNHIYENSPYIGIEMVEDKVKLFNWDGSQILVESLTGNIISSSNQNKRPW